MLFALVAGSPEPANCGLATVVMWISGSYCEWNKHHEEEAWPHFCCSILFPRSMHLPGCIQGGQEASYGYLLLEVYDRNSTSSTTTYATFLLNSLVSAVYEGQSGINNISNFNLWPMSYLNKKTFKGQRQEILYCRFFHESSSTKPLKITLGSFKFFENSQVKVHTRYQWHRYTVLAVFQSPAGMSLIKLSQEGNNLITPSQGEFGDIPAEDGKTADLFLQCSKL